MIQTQVLNYLLSSKDKDFLDKLRTDYFSSEFKNEFEFIKEHCDKYGNIPDQYTFLDKFEDFNIVTCSETPKCLLDGLIKETKLRNFIANFKAAPEMIDNKDIDSIITMLTDSLSSMQLNSDVKYINLLDGSDRYEKYLDKCDPENKTNYFISTGFKELDNILGGWDALEELAVIVARPNVGKSQLAIKCATSAVEQGKRVGIYSGEMSNEKVGYRVDTMLNHIPNYDLTRGDIKSQIIYKKYIDELPNKYKGQLWCLTPLELGHQATVSDLKSFIIDKDLDILFVDQYSLLEDQHHAQKENEKYANLSKDLKNLQVMVKRPIIAVSQQKRGNNDEEGSSSIIDVSNIAMADRIGQDATTVLFLTCKNNILDIYLSKSRDSEKDKKLSYEVNWNLGTFNYIPEPDKSTQSESDDELPFARVSNSEYADDDEEYNAF